MKSSIRTIAVLFALTATSLWAQGDRGIITGTVKDPSGASMPDAVVTAIHLATNTSYQTSTTASGDFTVPALPVGNYQVRVEKTGFKTQVENNVAVAAGATVRLDVVMEVGATQQTIEVQARAAMLTTDTARVSTEVSAKLVNELPLIVNGAVRSPFDLATTTAEVAGSGDSNFRIGGGRIGAFGVTLDGTAATVARPDAQVSWGQINSPSVEALTEFSVESGGFKAETGHASGGTISFVSKSGTNDFHGKRLRISAQRGPGRARLLRGEEGRVQTERLRRHRGRAGVHSEDIQRPQPDVLLLFLRGLPQSRRRHRQPPTPCRRRNSSRATCTIG